MRPVNPNMMLSGNAAATANKVLRKTYTLLSLTLIFTALCALYAMTLNIHINFIVLLIGMFGLYFLTISLRNSSWGIVSIFAYTGFMGFVLGPVLNMYLSAYVNGGQLIATAFGATAAIFLGLTAYALISRKDFSYMAGFLSVAIIGIFVVSLVGMFVHMPLLQLFISGAFAVLMSGFILYQTSAIIHGGETNAIVATIGLYIAIFNLFISLLQIFAAFSGNSRS